MKTKIKFSILLAAFFMFLVNDMVSQTITIGSGTSYSYSYGPMRTYPYSNYKNRCAYIVKAANLTGISNGDVISSIEFLRRNYLSGVLQGNVSFKVYMKNTTATSMSSTQYWNTITAGATLFYSGNPTAIVGNSAGWKQFPTTSAGHTFNTANGTNLMIMVEYQSTSAPSAYIYWHTTTVGGSYTTRYTYTTGTLSNSLSYGTSNKPQMKLNYYTPSPNDAGVAAITDPTGTIIPGSHPVKVTLQNFGTSTLTSASISWQVNGGTVNTYPWTGSLATGAAATNINLGNHVFVNGQANIKAWAKLPNGSADGLAANDTSYMSISVCNPLAGIYTIGGASADFATIGAAVDAVENCGVSAAVVFNIAAGTYTEKVAIGAISGTSTTNTVTFQGTASDSTAVVLTQASSTSNTDNYTLKLNGADYVRFKDMTIQRTGTSTYGIVVEIAGNADYNKFMNCQIFGSTSTSTSSAQYRSIIYNYNDATCDYNEFLNNYLKDGGYGIYYYGSSTARDVGTKFHNNVIKDQYYRAIYLYYQNNSEFIGNTVTNSNSTYSYFYFGAFYYCQNGFKLTHNNFAKTNNGLYYTLYFYQCSGTSGNRGLVANNFISVKRTSSGNMYGMYNYSTNYMNYYNNSINYYGTSTYTNSRCFYYSSGSNVNLKNNTFTNKIGGYAAYFYGTGITSTDYNNFYTSGTNLAYWSGYKSNLAALQAASGKDANSISVNPTFTSDTDLHTGDFLLNAKGTPVAEVTDDIDGEPRTGTPDIGADEFTPVGKDASIAWYQPIPPTAAGNKTVKVIIANAMTVGITAVNLTYTNGTTPVTQNFTGLNITQGGADTLSFTTPFNLSGASQLRAYINSVNGSGDLVQTNDTTAWQNLVPALSGTYTINNTQPTAGTNFNSFGDAVTALQNGGADGAVTFNVATGTYTEQITIGSIIGASALSPIIFQSASGDSTDVTLTYAATSYTTNWALRLNGANYVYFKHIKIQNTGSSYKSPIRMEGNSDYNKFIGCYITTPTNNSTSNYQALIYLNGGNVDNNTFQGNYLFKGSYGIYTTGGSNTNRYTSNEFIDNTFKNQYYRAIYMYFGENTLIEGNTIETNVTYTSWMGIYAYYVKNNTRIIGNYITKSTQGAIGMEIGRHNYYTPYTDTALVANNMISLFRNNSGNYYGIYAYYNRMVKFYNNSVNMYGTYNSNRAFYLYGSGYGGNIIKNNIFVSQAGYCFYSLASTNDYVNDYNNYWRGTGTNFYCYQSGNRNSLAAWKTATGEATNSVNMNPTWFSNTDLHTKSLAFNDLGTPLSEVTDDIDGETRSLTAPDIGADEFTPPARDISVTNIQAVNPVSGNQNILIDFSTYGTATLTTAQFNYSVNGTAGTTPFTWTGSLTNGQSAVGVNIGSFNFQPGQNIVKAWPVNVNGGADEDNSNDTATYNFTITVDAGIIAMDEASIQYGSSPVSAFIANYGTDNLISSTVGWSVNGVVQTPASWTGSITNGNADGPVALGNYTFAAGTYIIKIWTQAPNGITPPDLDNTNDTLTKTFIFEVDAGISQIDPPGVPGTQNVVVYVKNFGSIPLTSATIWYKVNSGAAASYSWSGNLAPGAVDGPITVGTGTFAYGAQTIKAWTASPNGGTDAVSANDEKTENFNITADIGVIDGDLQQQDNCGRGNDTLSLYVKNFGTGPVSGPFTISYKEGTSTTVTENVPASVTILPGDTFRYTFAALVNLAVTGADSTFILKGWTALTTDSDNSNDTITGQVDSWYTPSAPTTENDTVPYGTSAELVAALVNGDSLNWYDAMMGGNLVHVGDTFNTPLLYDTTNYYVDAQSYITSTGTADYTIGNGTAYTNSVPIYISSTGSSYRYSKFAGIYTAADLSAAGAIAGNINNLAFYKNGSTSCGYTASNATFKIYIKQITGTSVPSTSWTTLISGATLNYSSITQNINTFAGWQEFNFSTPFNWDGTSNLMVMVEWYRPSAPNCNYPRWNCTSVSSTRSKRYAGSSNSNNLSYANTYLPNIKVNIDAPIVSPECNSSRTPVTAVVTNIPSDAGVTYVEQPTETGAQNVKVALKNFTSVVLTSAGIDYEVNGTPGTTYNWTGSLNKDDSAMVTIGSGTFVYGQNTIKAWSKLPNGSADPNANNDTTIITFDIFSDIGVVAVHEPISGCALGNETVIVDIVNFGTDTVHAYAANFHIVGSASAVTENITTALAPGDTNTYTFTGQANLATTTDSVFKIWAYTTLAADNIGANDSTLYKVMSRPSPTIPVVENDTVAYGTPAELVATNAGFEQVWFAGQMGGAELLVGDTFNTPNLYDTTTYYVSSRSLGNPPVSVVVGNSTVVNQGLPIEPYYGYSYSQCIYYGSEINAAGAITDLKWYYQKGSDLSASNTWKIYIGYTNKTQFSSSTDWLPLSELTQVYSGTFASPAASGWINFDITDFNYDGTSNLIIAVEDNKPSYDASSDEFRCTYGYKRGIEYHNDNINPDPANPPTSGNLYLRNYFANVTFDITPPPIPICNSARVPVTGVVTALPSLDVGILKINSPQSGPGKTTAEVLNVTVKNYGTLAVDTIPVAYVLDGAAAVVDTVFANLNPGDTANFSFAVTMNMAAIATYNVTSYTNLSGDVVTNNDTAYAQIIHSDYCISRANSTADDDIGNVTIKHPVSGVDLLNKGIANPLLSNILSNKLYSDFTGLTPTILEQGQAYPFSMTQIESSNNFYPCSLKVYIDFNQDGILDAGTEMVYAGRTGPNAAGHTLMGNINIPANAALGNTRMRVVLDETGTAPPCGTYSWGETEDYTVNIVPQVWAEAGPHDTICNTFSSTLMGSGTGPNYAWSSMDNTASTTVSPTATTMYYLSVTDTYGFTAIDSAEVYVRDLPTLNFSTLADMCVDASALTLNMATPVGGTYSGMGVSTGTFDPATAGVGAHTIKYIYTDSHGCTDSTTQSITVNALPVLTLGTLADKCFDAPLFALNFATSPTGGTYSGPGVDASGNFTAATAGSGTHYIKYEYTDGNGCYSIDSVTQKVNALPVLTATSTPDTVFYGTTSTLDVSAVAGPINAPTNAPQPSASYSYLWSPADSLGSASNANTKSPTTKNLFLPTTFDVSVTDNSTSCANTAQVTVLVKGGPLSTTPIATIDTVCSGAQSQLKAQASGGSETYTYSWTSNPSGFTSTSADPFVNPTVTTMYYVTINDGFNSKTDSVEVYVHALPTGTPLSSTAAICLYDSTQLSLNFTGQSPWTIYVSDGTGTNTISGVTDPWNMYVNPSIATTYHLDSLIDGNGCFNTSSSQVAVTVWDLPTVSASGSDSMCYGDSIQFTLNFTGASPWEFDVSHISATMNQSNTETGITSPFTVWAADVESTVHNITRVMDAHGCKITGSPIDSVFSHVWSLPTVAVSVDSVFHCYGDSSMISLGFTGPTPWDITISDGTNSFTETVSSTPWTPYVDDTTSTWYYITTLEDDHGCVNNATQDSIYVNVWPLPTPTFAGLASAYCVDAANATLVPTPTGGTFTGLGVSGSTFSPATAGAGTYNVVYTYTDGNGCTNTSTNATTVNALPIISFSGLNAAYCVDAMADTLIPILPAASIVSCTTGCAMPTGYCTSGNSSSVDEYINNVTINSASKPSTGSLYSDFTSTVFTSLTKGQTYPMGVTVNANGYTEYVSVYIDWNRNGTFESGEATSFGSNFVSGNVTFTNSIVVPSTAVLGKTLMRVVCRYNTAPSSCGSYSYGETEDYMIEINESIMGSGAFTGAGIAGDVFTPSVAGVGSKVITYTYTDGNGCTNLTTDSTIINALPTITLSTLSDICISEPTFTISGASPSGGTWSGAGVSNNYFNANVAGAATHMLTYTYVDGNGCVNSDSTTQLVNALPVLSITGFASAYCVNGPTDTLTGLPAGGSFGGLGMSGNVFDPTLTAVGNISIIYFYTDANGCFNSYNASTIINPYYTPDFTGLSTAYCLNDSMAMLTPDSMGGTFSGVGMSGSNFDPMTAGVGTHDVTYSYTNGYGCTSSKMYSTNVMALPSVNMTGLNVNYCADAMGDTLVGTPAGGTFSGAVMGNIFDPSTAMVSANNEVVYSYTDTLGCSNTDTMSTWVWPLPTIALPTDQTVCEDVTVTLDAGANSTYNYLWATGGMTHSIAVDTSLFGLGMHSYSVVVTDTISMCTATDSTSVTFEAYPVIPIPDTFNVCGYNPVNVTAGIDPNYAYIWSDGSTMASILIDSSMTNGNYMKFSVTVSSPAGCTEFKEFWVKFRPDAVVDLGRDTFMCITGTMTLDAGSGYSYLWTNGATTQTIDVVGDTVGLGLFNYGVTVARFGCTATDDVNIMVNPCLGIDVYEGELALDIYPNPTKGRFTLDVMSQEAQSFDYNIFNMAGKILFQGHIDSDGKTMYSREFDMSTMPKGVYFIRIQNNDIVKVERIVIQ